MFSLSIIIKNGGEFMKIKKILKKLVSFNTIKDNQNKEIMDKGITFEEYLESHK